jgi:hypothetical protein
MNRHASKSRTGADRKQEVILFIYQATDKALLACTADQLCARHGIANRGDQREIEAALLARQDVLRRRAAA